MGKLKQDLSPQAQEYADRQAEEARKAAEAEAQGQEDDAEIGDPDTEWAEQELDLDTLAGDVRDVLLSRIRTMPKTWQQMSELEQREMAEGVAMGARKLVRDAVRLLNTYEWPHCVVALGEVKIKGEKGIEAKIGASNIEENRNVLGDHVNTTVMLVFVDSEAFMGEREPAEIDPDQPELPADNDATSDDDLYAKAVTLVMSEGKASTSFVQRRLAIGYNRAARIIERMEQKGVVSAADETGKRRILRGGGKGEAA